MEGVIKLSGEAKALSVSKNLIKKKRARGKLALARAEIYDVMTKYLPDELRKLRSLDIAISNCFERGYFVPVSAIDSLIKLAKAIKLDELKEMREL